MHLLVFIALGLGLLVPGGSVSYRSLVEPDLAKAFYSEGGKPYRNQRVHLHVPASRLLDECERTASVGVTKWVVFANKSVPIVASPTNVYLRKIRDRAERGDTLCIKGIVNTEPHGGKDRLALWLHTVKKADDKDVRKDKPKKR